MAARGAPGWRPPPPWTAATAGRQNRRARADAEAAERILGVEAHVAALLHSARPPPPPTRAAHPVFSPLPGSWMDAPAFDWAPPSPPRPPPAAAAGG
eukprot:gene18959-21902_t